MGLSGRLDLPTWRWTDAKLNINDSDLNSHTTSTG